MCGFSKAQNLKHYHNMLFQILFSLLLLPSVFPHFPFCRFVFRSLFMACLLQHPTVLLHFYYMGNSGFLQGSAGACTAESHLLKNFYLKNMCRTTRSCR